MAAAQNKPFSDINSGDFRGYCPFFICLKKNWIERNGSAKCVFSEGESLAKTLTRDMCRDEMKESKFISHLKKFENKF